MLQMLIEQEKAELREIERQREEEEQFKQDVIDAAVAVGSVTVAAGSAAVGAGVAIGSEVAHITAEAAEASAAAIRSAAGEVGSWRAYKHARMSISYFSILHTYSSGGISTGRHGRGAGHSETCAW